MLSKFILYSLMVILILSVSAFASTESSIFEVQRLLSLTNSNLLRNNLDAYIESSDEALSMVQELKEEEEEEENTIINNGNDILNGLEIPQEDQRGSNDDSNADSNIDTDDSDGGGGGIVDDNVERSQECIKNAKPGEVCAL